MKKRVTSTKGALAMMVHTMIAGCLWLFSAHGVAQVNTVNDSTLLALDQQYIQNDTVLAPLLKSLQDLSTNPRVLNIVHIGDSHVQGAVFPAAVRSSLQKVYGNAGRGFIFPYRLAGTNGDAQVRFSSSNTWHSVRNVKSDGRDSIGLSGILLETTDPHFVLKLSLDSTLVNEGLLQVLSPLKSAIYVSEVAPTPHAAATQTAAGNNYKNTYYKVKKGDNLSTIAQRQGTTVRQLKSLNNMRSTFIKAGQTLVINRQLVVAKPPVLNPIPMAEKPEALPTNEAQDYILNPGNQTLYFSAAQVQERFTIDGFVLKNNNPGVRYHAIGVNGAQFKDYNMFPRFFEQLAQLQPDLIIVSLGTNESFSETLTPEAFASMLQEFKDQLQTAAIKAPVLATSPPPSYKNRRRVNETATLWSDVLKDQATGLGWAFYDLHRVMKSSSSTRVWRARNLAAADLVHYTSEGYQLMGELLADVLIKTLQN